MAIIGLWSGGAVNTIPTTTWAAPASIITTQVRNDSSAYSWAAATSTLTLPSSGLADGYLVRWNMEFEDNSNGRFTPNGRVIQSSGTGNFVSQQVSGYNRDASEDRCFLQVMSVIDSPSASAALQLQWRRDTDTPTGGTVECYVEVIPLFYSNIGMYTGSVGRSDAQDAITTTLSLDTAVVESDTGAIELASDVVTLKNDNKRYLVLGSYYGQNWASARCQHIGALGVDGSEVTSTRAVSYARDGNNNDVGCGFSYIAERATTDVTLEVLAGQGQYRDFDMGTEINFTGTPTGVHNTLIVIELNDSAEVFRSHWLGTTLGTNLGQAIDGAAQVDIEVVTIPDTVDSSSFTKVDNGSINAEVDMDAWVAANVSAGRRNISSTQRHTWRSWITKNGTPEDHTLHGDYSRGDQSTTGTSGSSAHAAGVVALAANDDFGVATQEISGTESGTDSVAFASILALNLDSLEASGPTFNPAWAGVGIGNIL